MASKLPSLRVIEFYSGIGGMHYALKASKLEASVIAAIDINDLANKVYKHNFPDVDLMQRNIQSITTDELDELNADMILMSPPCQPFTRVGRRGDSDDPRTVSFLHLLDMLPKLSKLPNYILLENVRGFDTSNTRNRLVQVLQQCDYIYQEFLLSPTHFNIPNQRLRYFLVAKHRPLEFDPIQLSKDEHGVLLRQQIHNNSCRGVNEVGRNLGDVGDEHYDANLARSVDIITLGCLCGDFVNAQPKSPACESRVGCTRTESAECWPNGWEVKISNPDRTYSHPVEASADETSCEIRCEKPNRKATELLRGSHQKLENYLDAQRSLNPHQWTAVEHVPSLKLEEEECSLLDHQDQDLSEKLSDRDCRKPDNCLGTPITPDACQRTIRDSLVDLTLDDKESFLLGTKDQEALKIQSEAVHQTCKCMETQCFSDARQEKTKDSSDDKESFSLETKDQESSKIPSETAHQTSECIETQRLSDPLKVRDYLEDLSSEDAESFLLPDKLLKRFARIIDVVTADDDNTRCFTKAYGHYVEGTGSMLQMNSAIRGTTILKNCSRDIAAVTDEYMEQLKHLRIRYFTPREVASLHHLPSNFEFPDDLSRKQRYRCLGNSLNVHVVSVLLRYVAT